MAAATGSSVVPFGLLRLEALRGREGEASAAIANEIAQAATGGQGTPTHAHWAAAVLYNGLARYDEAVSSARHATSSPFDPWPLMWALPELVEAATHVGDTELARDAFERLSQTTQPAATDWALGIDARCRALLSDGAAADELYREAIDRLSRTRLRPELARAHLIYGEWLRREGRRVDAREQLHAAHNMFVAIGMEAFAERARRELVATGEHVRRARSIHASGSHRRKRRSRNSRQTDGRTRKSARNSSSAPAPSNGTCAGRIPSWAFDLGESCEAYSLAAAAPPRSRKAQTREWTRGNDGRHALALERRSNLK